MCCALYDNSIKAPMVLVVLLLPSRVVRSMTMSQHYTLDLETSLFTKKEKWGILCPPLLIIIIIIIKQETIKQRSKNLGTG